MATGPAVAFIATQNSTRDFAARHRAGGRHTAVGLTITLTCLLKTVHGVLHVMQLHGCKK